MSLLKLLFSRQRTSGAGPLSAPHSVPSQLHHSRHAAGSQNSARKDLLRAVLRDTLSRHGIPSAWIGAEMLVATSRGRDPGIHVRLTLKHWEPRLLTHGVALQQMFHRRVLALDPIAANWLMGISWQFALADESACPPMPHPGVWTAAPSVPLAAAPEAVEDLLGGSILISGPAARQQPAHQAVRADLAAAATPEMRGDARADLEALFAIRDDDMKRHAEASASKSGGQFAATEPAVL